jgi:flavin-dependent dehydrogenase
MPSEPLGFSKRARILRRHGLRVTHFRINLQSRFSGDGMSIALHSAHLAAQTFLAGGSAESFQKSLGQELRYSVTMASAVSRAVIACPALAGIGRLWPSLLRHIARRTRIPSDALTRDSGG